MTHSYYKRILNLCLALMLALLLIQSGVSFMMLRDEAIRHTSTISRKTLEDLREQIISHFEALDSTLDSIYQYPDYLAGLESESREKSEYPVRSLLSQTSFFRSLRCIWVYNMDHAVRGCYNRTSVGMYRQEALDIYGTDAALSADFIRAFIESETARFRVFCCATDTGDSFLRVVKRVYQNRGLRQVGYIVCDLNIQVLAAEMQKNLTSSDQYAWLYSDNGAICSLSRLPVPGESAYAFQQDYSLFHAPFSGMVKGNYFCCELLPDSELTICLFTDEIELRQNLLNVLKLLLMELALLVGIYIAFMLILSRRVSQRIRGVTDVFHRIEEGNTALRLPVGGRDEIDAICGRFNSMMDHMEVTTAEEAKLRRAFEEARYQSLQAQVNPHFLFNTMENIGAIALAQGCGTVDEMCGALSSMLRYSIGNDGLDRTVSLREELEYVRQYMVIINVRMNNQILLDIRVPEPFLSVRLPRLSVQPLVDNAIRHGLRGKRGEKRLNIFARPAGDDVEVVVENNGLAGDINEMNRIIRREVTRELEHTSIGICNIHERVQLLFGESYGLRAAFLDGMTQFILLLPGMKGGKLQ